MKYYRTIPLFALLMTVVSCAITRSTDKESRTTESVSVMHDTVYTMSYRDRVVTDTLHDSVYIREVVTTEGKTVYVEKNTSRDHKAQTVTKHDTVYVDRSVTEQSDKSETQEVQSKTTTNLYFLFYSLLILLLMLCAIVTVLFRKLGKI